jgi:hypothetical protein
LDRDLISLRAEGVENGEFYTASPDPAAPEGTGTLALRFDTPFEMVRLAFARTAEGEEEISLWSDAAQVDLAAFAQELPATEPAAAEDDLPPDEGSETGDDDGGGFSFGPELAAGFALFSLLFFFA